MSLVLLKSLFYSGAFVGDSINQANRDCSIAIGLLGNSHSPVKFPLAPFINFLLHHPFVHFLQQSMVLKVNEHLFLKMKKVKLLSFDSATF